MYINIDRLNEKQVEQLCEFYQYEWWSCGRTLADVQRMLNNSDLIFGMCEAESQNLVAFARILTDRVYRAMIFDVIVGANYRDRGLGAILIERILSHPELSQVECIHLFCLPDVIPFYEKFGFVLAEPSLLVRKRIEN